MLTYLKCHWQLSHPILEVSKWAGEARTRVKLQVISAAVHSARCHILKSYITVT